MLEGQIIIHIHLVDMAYCNMQTVSLYHKTPITSKFLFSISVFFYNDHSQNFGGDWNIFIPFYHFHLLTNFTHLLATLKLRWLRDHQQITFVTLHRFCLSNKKTPPPLFLKDNIKLNGIPTKITWKIHTLFTLHFMLWRYFL